MRAMWRDRYGDPSDLTLQEVPVPVPGPEDLLVKVHAAAINRSDWEYLVGSPFYARMQSPRTPGMKILGTDLAGEVVETGSSVRDFKVGDRIIADVMYHGAAAFAEYAVVRQGAPAALIPYDVTYSQGSTLPQAGTIALQGMSSVRQQDKVLLIGAGGATGIFAIQLARAAGATVTGVDSAPKLELMRGLGADHAVDYQVTEVAGLQDRFDLILDPIGGLAPAAARKLLAAAGTYWITGGRTRSLLSTLLADMAAIRSDKRLKVLLVRTGSEKLQELVQKLARGELQVPIENEYSLEELPVAIKRLGDGLAQGRLVIRPQSGFAPGT